MKTSVPMVRTMGPFNVIQRTKDSMFYATDLLRQWNRSSGQRKRIQKFLDNDNTKQFIEELENEEDLNSPNSGYLTIRGKQGGTWMHPYLFMKFAMWLNPKFEVQVIRFVYDQLIEMRHHAGDHYRTLSASIATFGDVDYGRIAKGMNHVVFGRHESGIRQTATLDQLKELTDLEKQLAFAVDMGYIDSYKKLLNELREIYRKKYRYAIKGS